MSIVDAYNEAWNSGDLETLEALIHDDFQFNPHVGGVILGKADVLSFAGNDKKEQ